MNRPMPRPLFSFRMNKISVGEKTLCPNSQHSSYTRRYMLPTSDEHEPQSLVTFCAFRVIFFVRISDGQRTRDRRSKPAVRSPWARPTFPCAGRIGTEYPQTPDGGPTARAHEQSIVSIHPDKVSSSCAAILSDTRRGRVGHVCEGLNGQIRTPVLPISRA